MYNYNIDTLEIVWCTKNWEGATTLPPTHKNLTPGRLVPHPIKKHIQKKI